MVESGNRHVGAIFFGLIVSAIAGLVSNLKLGKLLNDWLYQKIALKTADRVVTEAARRGNVFVGRYEEGRVSADYVRVYEFKYGSLQLRMTTDGMIEIAAFAPLNYGGGCMFPPPKDWDMRNALCGQGYRVPQSNREDFLIKVKEVSEWLVEAQSDFDAGGFPK